MSLAKNDFVPEDDDASRRTERLAVAMREIETFSIAVAHDLRIPLRAIHSAIAAISDHARTMDPEVATALRKIYNDAAHMQELLHRLLDLGRVASAPLDLEWVDMEALAWEAWKEVPRRRGIDLKIGKLPRVRGSKAMLRMVWLNLLCNAMSYLAWTHGPRIEVSAGSTDNAVIFGVRDNGRGFDLDYAGKLVYVLDKIQQQADQPGTGVALAIVQRIVTRHRGNVWIEGRRGEGAFVQFSLPLADAKP